MPSSATSHVAKTTIKKGIIFFATRYFIVALIKMVKNRTDPKYEWKFNNKNDKNPIYMSTYSIMNKCVGI